MTKDIGTIEVPRADGSPEVARDFIPTPERVSQYLELKTDEVAAQMKSVEGRKALYDQLIVHEEQLKKDHQNFDALALRSNMDDVGESLAANERYMKDIRAPEKQGMFRRAWETIKGFPRKHPVITTLLAAAAVAGGLYLAWNYLGAMIAIPNVMDGAAGVADTVAAPTGGAFEAIPQVDIVPPTPMPGPTGVPDIPMPMPSGGPTDFFPSGAAL